MTARRVVVIGAGVLGCEIAATARGLDCQVTLVDSLPGPMYRQVGGFLGTLLSALHTGNGVQIRAGAQVQGLLEEEGRVIGVEVDGQVLPADVVVVTIGSRPATGWLEGSGLDLDDGVGCDSRCQAAPGIYAAGDVARFHHLDQGARMRLENRTNAVEQAMLVAANVTGADRAYTPVPYFWTDQYGVRIQMYGAIPSGATVELLDGSTDGGRFVAVAQKDGRITAAVGWNDARGARNARQLVGKAAV